MYHCDFPIFIFILIGETGIMMEHCILNYTQNEMSPIPDFLLLI